MTTVTLPSDTTLPAMDVALDGDAMVEVLNRCLGAGEVVRTCSPYYVRYKPGKYCVVQYELEWSPGTSSLAFVAVYPMARVERLWSRWARNGTAWRSYFARELPGIVYLYPADPALPGLAEATSPKAMSLRLSKVLPHAVARSDCDVELVRYKATKRAVLRYRFDGAGAVYGKLRKDGGRHLRALVQACRNAGVNAPGVIGEFRDLGMIVQEEGRGTRLKDLRGSPSYQGWMEPVADALAQLHDSPVEGLHRRDPADEVGDLTRAASTVGVLLPELAQEAEELSLRLGTALAATGGETGAIHGSFHDDQLLVGDDGVVMVDLDSAAVGSHLADVGHLLSYLRAEGEHEAAERFLEAYGARRPVSADVHIFEAASLLRWATLPFRELRADWREAVAHRVRLAAERAGRYARH